MNPNDNNPNSPMGASGAGTVPGTGAPLDFTNPANLGNAGVGSATTAGAPSMATSDTTSTNIDGTMNSNISPATMPPLTPAEPVPGSIGSVTSVPPLAPEPMDMNALGGVAAGATASNMPVMGQAPENKSAAGTNESPYYNPFTRNTVGNSMGETASNAAAAPMSTPATAPMTANKPLSPAMQPKVEDKFAERLKKAPAEKKPSNVMTLLGWLLAILFAVAAVVLLVLWLGEKNKKPQVVYVPVTEEETDKPDDGGKDENEDNPVLPEGVTSVLKCTMEASETSEEMPGLISETGALTANYGENGLIDMSVNVGYVFTDADAASAAKPQVDLVDAMMAGLMEQAGVSSFSHGISQIDNVINYGVAADAQTIVDNQPLVEMFKIPVAEDGSKNTSAEAVRGTYEADGFVCTTE